MTSLSVHLARVVIVMLSSFNGKTLSLTPSSVLSTTRYLEKGLAR